MFAAPLLVRPDHPSVHPEQVAGFKRPSVRALRAWWAATKAPADRVPGDPPHPWAAASIRFCTLLGMTEEGEDAVGGALLDESTPGRSGESEIVTKSEASNGVLSYS